MTRLVPSLRLRTVLLTALFSFTTFFVQAAPNEVLPRPAALTPQSAQALACATNAKLDGYLTSSSASTTLLTRSTTGNVFGYVSNVVGAWSCTAWYRYSGLAWQRPSGLGNFDWGNLINSITVSCNWAVGSTDYLKANSTTDCADSDAEYAMPIYLEETKANHERLDAVFTNDTTPDATGDFMFIHSDCESYYDEGGGEVIQYNHAFTTTDTANRPGSNCDPLDIDGTNNAQTLVVDGLAPSTNIDWPTAAGPTLVSSPSVTVHFDVNDTVAGFTDSAHDWDLQRQKQTWDGSSCSGAWTDDGAAVSGITNETDRAESQGPLSGAFCYRWTLAATDANDNAASPKTSGIVRVDPGGNLGAQAQHAFESWDLGAGDALGVNVATGNLTATHPVADLPIRGGSLPITLAYNSLDPADVGFGPGWRLDLQRRLKIDTVSNDVTFTDATGARHLFVDTTTVSGVTNYTIPQTIDAELVRDVNQTGAEFTLTYKDRSADVFKTVGSEGLLRYIRDRHGSVNQVTVNYSGSTTDITTVVDPNGRAVTVSWNADAVHHVTSIVDWAVVTGGIVQTSGTPNRTSKFFYSSSVLQGWTDPLNTTASSCASPASHLTCLTYVNGRLATVAKTQTYTTLSGGALSTATRVATTTVTYRGSEVAAVRDATQNSTTETTIKRTTPSTVTVTRVGTPNLVMAYGLEAFPDLYGRVSTVTRSPASGPIVAKTTWHGSYPVKPASMIEDFGGPLARTVSNTWTAGAIGPNLATMTEPVTASENRVTTNTWNGNDDLTRTVVASSVSGSTTTDYRYASATNCTTGLLVCSMIANRIDSTKGGSTGNVEDVTTDYQDDGNGQRTRETRWNYAAGGALIDSRATGWTYDANGNLTSEIANYVSGSVTNPGDDVTPNATTNARTDLTTTHAYDTAGNRVSTTDPRRAIESAKGTSLQPDHYITVWKYDALNQRVSEETPTTPNISITQKTSGSTYDEFGAERTAIDFGGRVTATQFDAAGRAKETYEDVDDTGGTAAVITGKVDLDAAGRTLWSEDQIQANDPAGGTDPGRTELTYDVHGRTTASVDAFGSATPAIPSTTATTYDALDRVTQVTVGTELGAAAQTTKTAYDPGGRAISVDDEFTCTTTTYDYRDLVKQVVEGKTSATPCTGTGTRMIDHTIDGMGRVTKRIVVGGDTLEETTFDAAGRATKTWTLSGSTYRVVETTFNPLDEPTTEWRYTEISAVKSAQSWARTNRDPAGNETDRCTWTAAPTEWCHLASDTTWATPVPITKSSSAFDARNNRISQYTPGVGDTTYDPNANYQVAGVYIPTASGKEHQTRYTYDGRDRLDTITNVLCATNQRPCQGGNILSSVVADDYAYDNNDSRTQVVENNGSGAVTRHYCHDARNQLIGVYSASGCSSGLLETYAYDAAGNRTAGGGRTFTYDNEGQLATCSGTACSPTFDADGRLTKITVTGGTTWSYLYDGESRLVSVCASTSCTGSGFARFDSTYDGEGHRIKLVETPAAGTATTTEFRYEGDAVTSEVSTTGAVVITRTFTTDEAGAIIKMTIAGDPVSLHNGEYLVTWNGHGDALALSEINGDGTLTAANQFTYTTWGAPSVSTANGYADLRFRYLYVGRFNVQWDHSTAVLAGLLYMHARHYSPEFGRFLQPDPAVLEANLYGYTGNSPVTKVDPSGTFAPCLVPYVGWIICGTVARSVAMAVIGLVGRHAAAAPRAAAVIQASRDGLGRISYVTTSLTRANIGMGTHVTAAGRAMCCKGLKGYDAGHLIARILGGKGGAAANNIVPILSRVNRGKMRLFEQGLRDQLEKGYRVDVQIRVFYDDASGIPSQIKYTYRVMMRGMPTTTETFINK